MTDPNPVQELINRASRYGDAAGAQALAAAARDAAEALQILACTPPVSLVASDITAEFVGEHAGYTVEGDTLTLADGTEWHQCRGCGPSYVNDSYTLNGKDLTLWDGTTYTDKGAALEQLGKIIEACDDLIDEYQQQTVPAAEYHAWDAGYRARLYDENDPRKQTANPHPAPAPKVPQL